MAGYLWQLQYGMHVNVVLLFMMAFAATTDGQGRGEGPGLSSGLAESCDMIVEMCSSLYKRKLYDGGGDYSDERVCSVLQSFESCLRGSAKSCSGKISYDTLTTIISRILLHLCFELVL